MINGEMMCSIASKLGKVCIYGKLGGASSNWDGRFHLPRGLFLGIVLPLHEVLLVLFSNIFDIQKSDHFVQLFAAVLPIVLGWRFGHWNAL